MDNLSPGLSEDSGAGTHGRPDSMLSMITAGRGASARQIQESAIMAAVSRKMDALEDKLTSQIRKLLTQSDQSRDLHISRFDSKIGVIEDKKDSLDKRHAEMDASIQAVKEDLHRQVAKVERTDHVLKEWKVALEDELRTQMNALELHFSKLKSELKVAKGLQDDQLKKLELRVRDLEDDHARHADQSEQLRRVREDTTECLSSMHQRLGDVEARHSEHSLALRNHEPRALMEDNAPNGSLTVLQGRLEAAESTYKKLYDDNVQLRQEVKLQGERVNSLQQLVDAKDVDARLKESIEWDRRLKDVSNRLNTLEHSHLEHTEHTQQKLEGLAGHTQELQEIAHSVRRLQQHSRSQVTSPGSADILMALPDNTASLSPEEQDRELPERVSALIDQLKEISPKVIEDNDKIREQETALRQLQFKCNQLEQTVSTNKEMDSKGVRTDGGTWAALTARVSRLESEVCRLVDEVEGNADEDDDEVDEFGEDEDDEDHDPRAVISRQRRASATE